jgi:hypothetical protein
MRGSTAGLWEHRPVRIVVAAVLFVLAGWLVWTVAIAILHPPARGVLVVASFAGFWLVVGLLVLAVADTVKLLQARRGRAPAPEPEPHPQAWINLVVPVAFVAGIVIGHALST